MRLSPEHQSVIRAVVDRECGAAATVRLFGSRLDDSARGGDVDLLIELQRPVERPALMASHLSVLLSRALGGRAVDVVLAAPNLQRGAIHQIAERQGQLL